MSGREASQINVQPQGELAALMVQSEAVISLSPLTCLFLLTISFCGYIAVLLSPCTACGASLRRRQPPAHREALDHPQGRSRGTQGWAHRRAPHGAAAGHKDCAGEGELSSHPGGHTINLYYRALGVCCCSGDKTGIVFGTGSCEWRFRGLSPCLGEQEFSQPALPVWSNTVGDALVPR